MKKPVIIVLSLPDDEEFGWASVGWNTVARPNPPLFRTAQRLVNIAKDYHEAIALLERAGFEVTRPGE
jgi:hypothetical protein